MFCDCSCCKRQSGRGGRRERIIWPEFKSFIQSQRRKTANLCRKWIGVNVRTYLGTLEAGHFVHGGSSLAAIVRVFLWRLGADWALGAAQEQQSSTESLSPVPGDSQPITARHSSRCYTIPSQSQAEAVWKGWRFNKTVWLRHPDPCFNAIHWQRRDMTSESWAPVECWLRPGGRGPVGLSVSGLGSAFPHPPSLPICH